MSRFKVGDKVRLMQRNTVHTIIRVVDECRGLYKLSDGFETWGEQYLELVAPRDKKREFLERLQSLMREFDAEINIGVNVESKIGNCGVIFDLDNDRIFFPVCFSEEEYDPAIVAKRSFTNYPITADNIMDFDKE